MNSYYEMIVARLSLSCLPFKLLDTLNQSLLYLLLLEVFRLVVRLDLNILLEFLINRLPLIVHMYMKKQKTVRIHVRYEMGYN